MGYVSFFVEWLAQHHEETLQETPIVVAVATTTKAEEPNISVSKKGKGKVSDCMDKE